MSIVLQKFIADSGHCSRREAERLIREGKVKVNGRTAELGMRAKPGDRVFIGKQKIFTKREDIYIVLNKPVGYVCTNRHFENERSVFDLIALKERLFTIGRLDKNSRGLVFLTNDGYLAEKLSHPRYGHEKEYYVKVKKADLNEEEIIRKFKKGVDIGEGEGYVRAKQVKYLGENSFQIVLTEGKKRQIRRMFRACACEVVDLVRTRIGPKEAGIGLGKLPEGEWRFLEDKEVKALAKTVY